MARNDEAAAVSITIAGDASGIVGEFKRVKGQARVAGKAMSESMGKNFDKIAADAKRAGMTIRDKVGSAMKQVGNLSAGAVNGLAKVSAAAIAAGAAMKQMADEVHGQVDAMNTMAQASGLSIETINGLRRAALDANKDIGEIMPKDLAKRILETATGTGEAIAGFEALGIKATDAAGGLRSADDVLREAIDKLQRVEDPTARAALAVKVLGEEGKNMLSAFDSSEGLDKAVANAAEFGIRAGPQAVAASNAWWKATSNLTVAWEHAQQAFVDAFGDESTAFVNNLSLGFIQLIEFSNEFAGSLGKLGKLIVAINTQDLVGTLRLASELGSDAEAAWGRATETSKRFWEANLKGAEEFIGPTQDMIDGQDAITIKYEEMLNAAEAFAAKLRGKSGGKEGAGGKDEIDQSIVRWVDYVLAAKDATEEVGEVLEEHAKGDWAPIFDVLEEIEDQTAATGTALLDMFGQLGGALQTFAQLSLQETQEKARAAMREAEAAGDLTHAELAAVREEQEAAIERQFKQTKELQRVLAIIDAARAAVSLIPSFAALGPAAPLAAAAVAGAGLAAQLAVIDKQQAPSFPTGGVYSTGGARAGHGLAWLEPGEGVSSRRAMSDPDFRAMFERANSGEGLAAPQTDVRVTVSLDPSAQRLRVVTDQRPGKRPRRAA